MARQSDSKPAAPQQASTRSFPIAQSASTSTQASFQVSAPSISLSKGGGAIRGIVEKFGVNPVTGTGSLTIPIYTIPGRSGFGPQLSLSYDSGVGNGPPTSIMRKIDKRACQGSGC